MDKFGIDSHKLVYHVDRVSQWLRDGDVYPIYAEVGLAGRCNHRCIFCAFDFMQYNSDPLPVDCAVRFMEQAGAKGVRSVLFSGEGEPLLHPDFVTIVTAAKNAGIDAALATNGVLLVPELAEKILDKLTWIKVSMDAGCPETYAKIRRTDGNDFNKVIENLTRAVEIRERNNYSCTIGVQSLMLPDNIDDAQKLAGVLQKVGVDYLVIKPYSQHPSSINSIKTDFKEEDLNELERVLKSFCTDKFNVIFRRNAMENINRQKEYTKCYGLPFAVHISNDGQVYPCNVFVGKEDFSFGNICQDGFISVWEGQQRKNVMEKIAKNWDLNLCRNSCRLEQVNRYLWKLKNPPAHVNFI